MSGNNQSRVKSAPRSGSMDRLSEQSGKVADEVRKLGRVAMASAGGVATDLREKGEHALESGVRSAKMAKVRIDDLVIKHPMRSLLIALGVGAFLGYVLRHRS